MDTWQVGASRVQFWILALVLATFSQQPAFTQTQLIEICEAQLKQTEPQTAERLNVCLKLTDAYYQFDLAQAEEHAKTALALAKALDDQHAVSVCEMDLRMIQAY